MTEQKDGNVELLANKLNAHELTRRRLETDDKKLRRLLWLGHGCSGLYGDDGEMQCSSCGIDFRRDPVGDIEEKTELRGARVLDRIAKLEKVRDAAALYIKPATLAESGKRHDRLADALTEAEEK